MGEGTIPKIMPRRHPVTGEVMSDRAFTRSPEVNRQYRAFVSDHACCHCGKAKPSDPHHLGGDGQRGTGLKTDDFRCVPLCRTCHDEYHDTRELSFWGDDTQAELELVIARLLCEYFNLDVVVSLRRETT